MSKEKLIPELRFPEFIGKDEWKLDNVNSLFDLQDGYPFSSKVFTSNPKNGRQVIRITDINNQNKNSEKVYIPEDKIDDLGISAYSVENGDLLLSLTGAAGFNFYIWGNGAAFINQRTMKITPRDSKNEFLKVILSPLIHEKINGIGTGQNNNLSKDALKAIQFPVPQPQEQQKIASCLSSLDEVISAHSQKLDLLKDHKKGLMQNLFPQEGENVPKYRFPEFEGDGEWELKPLEELCKLVRGPFGGALKKEIFVEEGYAVYEQSHAIYSDFRYFRYRINEEKYNELKRFSVRAGDLIMSCSGTMGKFSMIPDDSEPGVINQALLKLSVRNGNDIFFVKTSLETDTNQRKLLSQSAGGAIKNVVSVSQIRILELAVPKMREQQKIASCLSAVDELITAQQEKIEQLKLHKKGLMQGLFPKIND